MMNLSSFDTLGKSGLALMQTGLNSANAAGAKVLDSGADPMSIAEASMDMSKAKVQMAMGAFLVKTQNELTNTALEILMPRDHKAFGIGINHDRYY